MLSLPFRTLICICMAQSAESVFASSVIEVARTSTTKQLADDFVPSDLVERKSMRRRFITHIRLWPCLQCRNAIIFHLSFVSCRSPASRCSVRGEVSIKFSAQASRPSDHHRPIRPMSVRCRLRDTNEPRASKTILSTISFQ